ncbi:MAG: hypothetical protein AAGB25_09010 [Pseudomonadota bacterium]
MKRAHRRLHLTLWLIFAPFMAVVIWAALAERPADPVNEDLPATLFQEDE